MLDESERDVLAELGFPREHRPRRHSTITLECLNGEIKLRLDVIGIFPGEAAIIRLVGALLLEQSGRWATQRRYMSLQALAARGENGEVGRPAIDNLRYVPQRYRYNGQTPFLHDVSGRDGLRELLFERPDGLPVCQ